MVKVFALLMFLACMAGLARAGEATPAAADPALEARVMKLAEELRCLVCQNQTIADSHAPLAVDLKNQAREMMAAGRSEREVVEYMVARYGDFVLYRPPLKGTTLLLWVGPLLLILGSLHFLVGQIRQGSEPAGVDEGAASRADTLLGLSGRDSR